MKLNNMHIKKEGKGTLFVVATPIGNISDLSDRAREILGSVDEILCEDTRVTRGLLDRIDVKIQTSSIHQHSTDSKLQKIIDRLESGINFAYVSDAGTPNVSDPGGKLVALAALHHINIITIPGPSAITTAISVCGFPADTFTFLGFPPHKKGRRTFFNEIDDIPHTVVLFESKHRILKTLEQLPQKRLMFVGRELTKMYETMYRGTASEISKRLNSGSIKGEFVIVLAPKKWK